MPAIENQVQRPLPMPGTLDSAGTTGNADAGAGGRADRADDINRDPTVAPGGRANGTEAQTQPLVPNDAPTAPEDQRLDSFDQAPDPGTLRPQDMNGAGNAPAELRNGLARPPQRGPRLGGGNHPR